jgi:membrane fusion protein, heavy metal efflux system
MQPIHRSHLLGLTCLLLLSACNKPAQPVVVNSEPEFKAERLEYPIGSKQASLLKVILARPTEPVMVDLPARITWNEAKTQRIYSALTGRVSQIRVDVGQAVQAGTVLANLNSPDLGQAITDAGRSGVDERLAQKTLARQQELYAAGVIARKDLEQSEADLERIKLERVRTEARAKSYGGGNANNPQFAITSSLSGVVVERNINPGQEVRPDQSGQGVPPLFVISDPNVLWVQIDAKETELRTLKPGAEFELLVPMLPNDTFKGKIIATGAAIDPTTRTIKVRAEVANPNRLLKVEMLATARLLRHMGGGIVIPMSAVMLQDNEHVVFVEVAAGSYEQRVVKLSYQDSKQATVTRGLEVNDKVVAENVLLLSRQFALSKAEQSDKKSVPTKS